jgi:hypothetical protein
MSGAERMNVSQALRIALADTEYTPSDTAAVALAVKFAEIIDGTRDAKLVADLGLKLLAVLTALGMTPAARAALTKGVTTTNGVNPNSTATIASLREFTDTRRARLHATPNMDTAP